MYVILHMSVFTQDGVSPLMWAASEGRTEAVVELVKSGADPNLQSEVCHMYIPLVLWSDVANVCSLCRNVRGNVISYSASLGLSSMYCDMYHMCIVWFVEVRFLVFSFYCFLASVLYTCFSMYHMYR